MEKFDRKSYPLLILDPIYLKSFRSSAVPNQKIVGFSKVNIIIIDVQNEWIQQVLIRVHLSWVFDLK